MTIDPKSDLARAYRIARRSSLQFFEQQAANKARRRSSQYPCTDGPGAAVKALEKARQKLASGKSVYGGLPGKRYPDTDSAFRSTTPAHDVSGAGIDHNGWYTDPFCDVFRDGTGLCFGVVCQLPGKGGRARYVAGYQFGGVDGGPDLDLSTVYESESTGWHGDTPDAMVDAARAADELARIAGEDEREYQTAWQAGSQWAGELETLKETRRETLALLKQNRESGGSRDLPAIHATICKAVCDARERINEARDRMAELAEGECESLYFWSGDERLQGAFCEGAGIDAMPGACL